MTRIIGRTRIPIAMAIVLLLSMGMMMPVAAEEVQAEDEVFSIGGYDLGLFPFDTEAGVSEGIDPEIAAMSYRLVNPDYVPEEFVILRTGGEFSAEDVKADGELLEEQWEEICGKFVGTRPIGFSMPIDNKSMILSAYGIAIRPDGSSRQYFAYGSEVNPELASLCITAEKTDSVNRQSVEEGAAEWKDNISKELSAFTLANSRPYLLGTEDLYIYVNNAHGFADNYGYIHLLTDYYFDNQEKVERYDYYFAKTTLITEPGKSLWNNGWRLSDYKLYQNWKTYSGVQNGINPLPGLSYKGCYPHTTSGFSTQSYSLSPGTATLSWSTQIPDQKVRDIGSSTSARAGWDLIFNSKAECAETKFEFVGASAVLCDQKKSRDGKTYGLCSVTVNYYRGWTSRFLSWWVYGPESGTTSISHIYAVRWS